jgi:hypothetical protein
MRSTFLDLGTGWRWVVSFMSRLFYPRNRLYRKLGGPQILPGRCGEMKVFDLIVSTALMKKTPWPESPRELYRLSYRRLSANLVPTFADMGCYVISVTDHQGRIFRFLDRSRHFFFQVSRQLYSRGWVDPVPNPLLLRKCGSARKRTRTSGSVARNSAH